MENNAGDAKQHDCPKFCTISDLEVTEKEVHVTSDVDEGGNGANTIENYYGDVESGYYFCQSCGEYYPWTMQNRDKVWKTVKEHLSE